MSSKTGTRVDNLIRDAFAGLLAEKEFPEIKVTDIISRANVSRSAFYSHYYDKYELIDCIENELFEGLRCRLLRVRSAGRDYHLKFDPKVCPICYESSYFEYIMETKQWWSLFLVGKGRSDFVQRLTHFLFEHFKETQESWNDAEDPNILSTQGLVIGSWAYVGLISYWVETGMKESPDVMGRALAVFWSRYKIWS